MNDYIKMSISSVISIVVVMILVLIGVVHTYNKQQDIIDDQQNLIETYNEAATALIEEFGKCEKERVDCMESLEPFYTAGL
jgi:uncharacterized protein (UPF0333 family)